MQNNNNRRNVNSVTRASVPVQSCSSLASVNTSPVSTLTGSSEADVSCALQESNTYNTLGCDSIGSLMSVSISGNSNGSASPLSRRHSVTSKYYRTHFLAKYSKNKQNFVSIQLPNQVKSKIWQCSKRVKHLSAVRHDRVN